MMNKKLDKWLDILNYWYDHVEEFGERYPDMAHKVKEFSKLIDDMYDLSQKEEKEPLDSVYVVHETNLEYPDESCPLYACSSFEKAQNKARKLNKEYGQGCVFDENWDFVEYNCRAEPHYYGVSRLKLDEPLAVIGD